MEKYFVDMEQEKMWKVFFFFVSSLVFFLGFFFTNTQEVPISSNLPNIVFQRQWARRLRHK